ncbi:MAG: DNA primase [Bacilli bacterium]
MDITANQFAMRIGYTLELSKITSHNPLKINFRCPLCGDSAKDKYAKRGWFYEYKGVLRFGCFNCNRNKPFVTFMKEQYPDLFREYLLEKNGPREKKKQDDVDLTKLNKTSLQSSIKQSTIEKYCKRLDLLPEGHPALLYMQNRLIPEDKMNLFWFTMQWKELTNEVSPGMYPVIEPEPRIVIPIFDDKKEIACMQGRALRTSEKIRYMTIKSSEDAKKVYGLERIDPNERVFYLEGPIDSVFIDNALAIVGGTMSLDECPYPKQRVWVLDNEPRSPDTCKRLFKMIEAGEHVVLWDKARWSSKDVNDMIMKEGATREEINRYLRSNIVKGLTAKVRFMNWKKVKL